VIVLLKQKNEMKNESTWSLVRSNEIYDLLQSGPYSGLLFGEGGGVCLGGVLDILTSSYR